MWLVKLADIRISYHATYKNHQPIDEKKNIEIPSIFHHFSPFSHRFPIDSHHFFWRLLVPPQSCQVPLHWLHIGHAIRQQQRRGDATAGGGAEEIQGAFEALPVEKCGEVLPYIYGIYIYIW